MPDNTPLKLSDLTGMIREHLQDRFARESFWVLADVSDHKFYPQKKYHYFDLVEKDATSGNLVSRVSAAAWQEGSKRIELFEKETGQRFTTGIHVLLKVKVEYTALYGLKLVVLDADTRFTLGELERKKQETIRRLLADNLDFIRMVGDKIVTRNQGHPLKLAVQKIAVLGSRQSAGYDDFMHTLAQNPYRYAFDVDTYHVAVQGEDKARQLFEQLLEIFKSGKVYDAVVIIRGGGSESDFLIFNDYNLNRAIAKFPIPVITGIGHLKDQSIADLMAHTETKTPTKAAEYIIAHNKMFEDRIMVLQKHLVFKAQQICSSRQRVLSNINTVVVNKSRDYLQHYSQTLLKLNQLVSQRSVQILHQRKNDLLNISGAIVVQPKIQVAKRRHEIDMQVNNLHTFRIQFIKQQVNQLQHLASMIRMASPEQTLQRGFAIVKHQGKVIRNANGLSEQEELTIVMQHTEIKTVIKEIAENHERPYNI